MSVRPFPVNRSAMMVGAMVEYDASPTPTMQRQNAKNPYECAKEPKKVDNDHIPVCDRNDSS